MTRPPLRLYCTAPVLTAGAVLSLTKESAHYISTVMRAASGDMIELFNGHDGAWFAEILTSSKNRVEVRLAAQTGTQEVPDDIWLCAAPLKKNRIDWLAEKACELGVAAFQPVLTRRTIVDKLNVDRLSAHMREAAEQCGRTFIPPVREMISLSKLLETWPQDRTLIFCDEGGGADLVATVQHLIGQPLAILIGPEGGFDSDERALITTHPCAVAVTLGPRILRADTAAVAALSVIQATIGGWARVSF
jgi:16S rRNA (uracil1498-N3)-methyltransferase